MKLDIKLILKNIFIGLTLIVCQGTFGMEPDLNTQLVVAAKAGDGQKVKWLLAQGANVDAQEGSPLRAALKNGHLEIAKLLLDHNANVEAPSSVTKLDYYGRPEIDPTWGKKSLLFEICDRYEIAKAHWPVKPDLRKAIVKLLLAYGANPMFPIKHTTQMLDEDVYTPLSIPGYGDIRMILVAAISNADAEQIRKNFYASMHAIKGNKELVNADARRLLAKAIFDRLVQERMQRAEDMIKRADRNDLKTDSFKIETRKMIAAELKRILSCSGGESKEYSSEDPSEWKPDLSCTIL